MEALIAELRRRGHTVLQDHSVAVDSHFLDAFVDVPPYTHDPHLKLALAGSRRRRLVWSCSAGRTDTRRRADVG